MQNRSNVVILIVLYFISGQLLVAQNLAFRYLGNSQGMNSLTSWNCAIDKYGFFWVATTDGLVRFNGKETTYFFRQTDPELPSDQIGYVFCDSYNNIWVCTNLGLVMLDEKRKFTRQLIVDIDPDADVSLCFESGDGDMYAITGHGVYSLKRGEKTWIPESWMDSLISNRRIRDIRRFDQDQVLIILPSSGVLLVNTKTRKEHAFFKVQGVNCATRFSAESILIGTSGKYGLLHAHIDRPSELINIPGPSFFQLNENHEQINYMVQAADHNVYMTTIGKGLLRIDNTLTTYTHYVHDPVNPSTIINNNLRFIIADSSGNLVITSVEGVNYSNVNNNSIEHVNYQQTQDGELIDERVISIVENNDRKLWMCTKEKLMIYDADTKRSVRIYIPFSTKLNSDTHYPMCVERAENDDIWVALRLEGIAIFRSDGRFKKLISSDDYPGFGKVLDYPRILREGHDGFMYVGMEDGLCRISHEGFKLDTFLALSGLAPLRHKRIVDILLIDSLLWVTTSPNGAAWRYSFIENKLTTFNTRNGLVSRRVYALTPDKTGNIYIGTRDGLSIIQSNDSIINLTKGHSLFSDRVEAIETAEDGSIWMTNNFTLLKYNPVSGDVFKLGGRHGLTNANFAILASAILSSGKLVFGVSKGLIIVDPANIRFEMDSLNVFAFFRNAEGKEVEWLPGTTMDFNYKENNIQFSFATSDMMIADQVQYRYRLSSGDESPWSTPSLNSVIDFNLNPGSYTLEVEAFDGHKWYSLSSPIQFKINSPWWKQWWFIVLIAVVVFSVILVYFNGRIQKFRKELEVARQITDLESKALRAQMNPHFVFNSLNAIQECIVTGKVEEAYTYLSTFSKLLRMVLEHSDVPEVTLQEELEVFSLYMSLEKLRFKDDMNYLLNLDKELDPEEIFISPMLIQPHLENAIWHGLRHKEGDKHINVTIKESPVGYLEVIIEDDGIGRTKAGEIRQHRLGAGKHRSKGKQLSENRMILLKNAYPSTSMNIIDLHDIQGNATGTKVVLTIPMLEKRNVNSN